MNETRGVLHELKVVVDAVFGDERALVRGHHVTKQRGKPKGESFGKKMFAMRWMRLIGLG